MPYKVTLKILLFFAFLTVQFNLRGQALSDQNRPDSSKEPAPSGSWYFPYETLEKAIAADPAASERFISLDGPWKLSGDEASANFHLSETLAEKQLFISPDVRTTVTIWVNGQKAGQTEAGSRKQEFNISPFIRPGENLLTLKLTPYAEARQNTGATREVLTGTGIGTGATDNTGTNSNNSTSTATDSTGTAMGVGNLLLYSRPETHFRNIAVRGNLDQQMRNGLLAVDMRVENRMDSVKERFWGVLREPIYSTVNIEAQLVDTDGNTVAEFKQNNVRKIRGGDSVAFHFEETINNVKPWSHETPYCYQLNIKLFDASGRILEVVSQQVGFRTAEVEKGILNVNGVQVPLRIFEPAPRALLPTSREQLMQDIREIKQGNFNAVYASSYFGYPSWYQLCNMHGVYILNKRIRGNKNNPSVITLPEKEGVPETGKQVVDIRLADFLKGTIRIRNDFAFRDLSGYYLQWEILRNGEPAAEGQLQNLLIKPGEEASLSLGYNTQFYQGNDYFLNLRLKTKVADSLVPADFTIASCQFRLGPYEYEKEYQVNKGLIDMTDGPGSIALNGYDFRIVFTKDKGQISRYSYKGKELMNEGPELNFRKLLAPGDSLKENHALWNEAADRGHIIDYKITEDVNGNYYISFTKVLLGGDARLFQSFRVDGRGAILVENVFVRMQGDYPLMPGFGTSFKLPGDYQNMEWYGREPQAGNKVGVYQGSIDEYAGSDKQDVRWVRFTRADGYGLLIRKEDQFLNLTTLREGPEDGPVLFSVDLSQNPVPFKSRNFTYRIIPYLPQSNVQ